MTPKPHPMTKADALMLLGGNAGTAAARIGITRQAVNNWPEVLSDKIRDRVYSAMWREMMARYSAEMRVSTGVRKAAFSAALDCIKEDMLSKVLDINQ